MEDLVGTVGAVEDEDGDERKEDHKHCWLLLHAGERQPPHLQQPPNPLIGAGSQEPGSVLLRLPRPRRSSLKYLRHVYIHCNIILFNCISLS